MTDTPLHSFAVGLAHKDRQGEIIEVFYPLPLRAPDPGLTDIFARALGVKSDQNLTVEIPHAALNGLTESLTEAGFTDQAQLMHRCHDSHQTVIACFLAHDRKPAGVAEVYLKLHLLSHRLAEPNTLNLEGAFGILRNLAWTNKGPIPIDELGAAQLAARLNGELLEVMSVDKFPRMTQYVVPSGVRIAHSARVRLGAYLGEGTTVMHEGFVNFNAGTAGNAMVEGRISAGVWVGRNSDLGGGCSIMGTLSGGGKEVITVGENCLIGANAGIGFPLGDRCIVEAGLYVTAGTKVNLLDRQGHRLETVKARTLSGQPDLLFRRNSLTGAVECLPNGTAVELNADLHGHN